MRRTPFAHIIILIAFIFNSFGPVPANAQDFLLPKPGVMVRLSPPMNPPILKGIKVNPDNPFRFDFVLDKGDSSLSNEELKDESSKLIKYFLASLTIPEKDLWVNLSPYEKDRIVPESFGMTEMGRDLLAEDYMLKQITASLIYPEGETGKKFWKRIYEEAQKKYGNTNIPVNTFNKVWIVPEKAVVYENAKVGTAYVVESKLKVMLEEDYLSLEKHTGDKGQGIKDKQVDTHSLGSQIVREIVIPELTKEVNEGKNFSQLRQVYNSLILATWYKKKIKDSILSQVYADKSKTQGVNIDDPQEKEKIYRQYLQAFKKGVYNYIKEESDSVTHEAVPRKYFSGGLSMAMSTPSFGLKEVAFQTETTGVPSAAMISVDHALRITAQIKSFTYELFGSRTGAQELDEVISKIGALESAYRRNLNDIQNAAGRPIRILRMLGVLEEISKKMEVALLGYLKNLDEGTAAYQALDRYTKEFVAIDEKVMDVLALYLTENFPSRPGLSLDLEIFEPLEDRAAYFTQDLPEGRQVSAVEQQVRDLIALKSTGEDISERSKKLMEEVFSSTKSFVGLRGQSRFEVVLKAQALQEILQGEDVSPQQIEYFVNEPFEAVYTGENRQLADRRVSPDLVTGIKAGILSEEQKEQLQQKIISILVDNLKAARKAINRPKVIAVVAAVAAVFIILGAMIWSGTNFKLTGSHEAATSHTQEENRTPPSAQEQPKMSEIHLNLNEILKLKKLTEAHGQEGLDNQQPKEGFQKAENIRKARAQIESLQKELKELETKQKQREDSNKTNELKKQEMEKKSAKDLNKLEEEIGPKKSLESKPPQIPKKWNDAKVVNEGDEKLAAPKERKGDLENKAGKGVAQVDESGTSQGAGHSGPPVWVAQAHGDFNFLREQVFYQSTLDGNMISKGQWYPITLSNEETDEWVRMETGGNREIKPLMPVSYEDGQAYRITKVQTENKVDVSVTENKENGVCKFHFSGDPGEIRVFFKLVPSQKTETHKKVMFVDDHGNPLSQDKIDQKLKETMPAALWDAIQEFRTYPLEMRQQIRDRMLEVGLIYYSQNSKLAVRGQGIMKSLFMYFAAKCDGFAFYTFTLSEALLLHDTTMEDGYVVGEDGNIYNADAHRRNNVNGKYKGAIDHPHPSSPLNEKVVTSGDEAKEKDFIDRRAQELIDQAIPVLIAELKDLVKAGELNSQVKEKEKEIQLARKRLEEARMPKAGSSKATNEIEISSAIIDNCKHLEQLRDYLSNPNTNPQQVVQTLTDMIQNISFSDVNEYMITDLFINGIFEILEQKRVDITSIKKEYEAQIKAYKDAHHINDDLLMQPDPGRVYLDAGHHNSGAVNSPAKQSSYLVLDQGGKKFLVDLGTQRLVEIPNGYIFYDYHAGILLFQARVGLGGIVLIPQEDGHYQREDFNDTVLIFHIFSSPNHWIGFMGHSHSDGRFQGRFVGPMAQEYGLANLDVTEPFVHEFQGEVLIWYKDLQGVIHFVGPASSRHGLNGQTAQEVKYDTNLLYQRTTDHLVLAIKDSWGWQIHSSVFSRTPRYDVVDYIKQFPDGQWIASVKKGGQSGFAGYIKGNGYNPFFEFDLVSNGYIELPSGNIVLVDSNGKTIGGARGEYIRLMSRMFPVDADTKGVVLREDIKRSRDRLHWIGKAERENKFCIVASPEILSYLGGKFSTVPNGTAIDLQNVTDYQVFENGEFYIVYFDRNNNKHITGTWVDKHLKGVPMKQMIDFDVYFSADPHFLGQKDPQTFIVFDKSGTKRRCFGPIADALDLGNKKWDFQNVWQQQDDGTIGISYLDGKRAMQEVHWSLEGSHSAYTTASFDPGRKLNDFSSKGQILDFIEFLTLVNGDINTDLVDKDRLRDTVKERKKQIVEGLRQFPDLVKAEEIHKALAKFGLDYLMVDLAVEALTDQAGQAKVNLLSELAQLGAGAWENIFTKYYQDLESKLGIDHQLSRAVLSLVKAKKDDLRDKLYQIMKEYIPSDQQEKLDAYEKAYTDAVDIHLLLAQEAQKGQALMKLPVNQIEFGSDEELTYVSEFFHRQVPDVDFPFDIEAYHSFWHAIGRHALGRAIMNDPTWMKFVDHEQLKKWHKINAQLNDLKFQRHYPVRTFSVTTFLKTFGQDPMAICYLLGVFYLIAKTVNNGKSRQRDRVIDSARRTLERAWQANTGLDGESYGSAEGLRELTERIFEGPTAEDIDELKHRRSMENATNRAFIDALMALPFAVPQEKQKPILKGRAFYETVGAVFVPLLVQSVWVASPLLAAGVWDASRNPKGFKDRQVMKKEMEREMLEEFAKSQEDQDPQVFLDRIMEIVKKYGTEIELPQTEQTQQTLSFEEVRNRVLGLGKQFSKVMEEKGTRLSSAHDGHPSKKSGSGAEYKESRPYVPGDDIKRIDWKRSGKSDDVFMKDKEQDLAVRTGIAVSLSDLIAGDERAVRSLADAVNVNFKVLRTGRSVGGDNYKLCTVILIKSNPDGTSIPLPLELKQFRSDTPADILGRILEQIESKYADAVQDIKRKNYEINFYSAQQNRQWQERQSMGAPVGFTAESIDKLREIRDQFVLQKIYIAGMEDEERQKEREGIKRAFTGIADIYSHSSNGSSNLGIWKLDQSKSSDVISSMASHAMAKRKGGINLNSENLNLQIQNSGEGIKLHMDPAQLQELRNAPGFYPVIINIQPMTDVKAFLGISS